MIRSATDQDIDTVLISWDTAGGPSSATDTREGLACLMDIDCDALLVAELDGGLVGSLIAAWDGWRGSFYRLAVQRAYRRRGIATALVREGERRLRVQGAVRLTAIVDANDPGALAFWDALGYSRQGRQTRFVRLLQ